MNYSNSFDENIGNGGFLNNLTEFLEWYTKIYQVSFDLYLYFNRRCLKSKKNVFFKRSDVVKLSMSGQLDLVLSQLYNAGFQTIIKPT